MIKVIIKTSPLRQLRICDSFLDAIASPSSYPCQSVGQWVSEWVIDSYRISELCELVKSCKESMDWIRVADDDKDDKVDNDDNDNCFCHCHLINRIIIINFVSVIIIHLIN